MITSTLELQRPLRAVNGSDVLAPNPTTLAAESANLRNQRDKDRLTGILMRERVIPTNNWKWFNRIGEVHFAITRASKIAGYAKPRAAKLTPSGEVEDFIDTGIAADLVSSVYSRVGGTRGLIERYFIHQKVPGESHLIRWMEGRSQDGFMFVSSKELGNSGNGGVGVKIAEDAKSLDLRITTMPGIPDVSGAFTKPIAQKDYLGRVWSPSPEYIDVPESPLLALDRQCDMLDSMTRMMQANLKSRFVIAGIMYFSSKVKEAFGAGTKTSGPKKTVLETLYDIFKQNIVTAEDSSDVSSILPVMMMGDALPSEVMEHLTMDRTIFETDLQLRSELIDRILFGLDINAPSTKGNTETSHWGAWQNSADELRLAVIPDLEGFCWTVQRLIVAPGINNARGDQAVKDQLARGEIGVTFELDEASVRANRATDARELRKQGLIKGLSAVKAGGFNEGDLLDGVEYFQWLGVQLRIPKLAAYGTPEFNSIDWDDPAMKSGGAGPKTSPGGDDQPSAPGEGDPGSPSDTDDDTPKGDKPI